jgi:ligand-binding SRPBCC domain-containing protein
MQNVHTLCVILFIMITLEEITLVPGPPERAFDLARSVEVHLLGNTHFGEQTGVDDRRPHVTSMEFRPVTTGLIGPGERVTWRARHFWVSQRLTSAITAYDRPAYFQDTMLRGAFHSMQHDHWFRALTPEELARRGATNPVTEMRDSFRFSAPLGPLGWLAERLVLRRYMRNLLRERNRVIAEVASGDAWRRYLA